MAGDLMNNTDDDNATTVVVNSITAKGMIHFARCMDIVDTVLRITPRGDGCHILSSIACDLYTTECTRVHQMKRSYVSQFVRLVDKLFADCVIDSCDCDRLIHRVALCFLSDIYTGSITALKVHTWVAIMNCVDGKVHGFSVGRHVASMVKLIPGPVLDDLSEDTMYHLLSSGGGVLLVDGV